MKQTWRSNGRSSSETTVFEALLKARNFLRKKPCSKRLLIEERGRVHVLNI